MKKLYKIKDIDTLEALQLTSSPMTKKGLEIVFIAYVTNENDFESWLDDMLKSGIIEVC